MGDPPQPPGFATGVSPFGEVRQPFAQMGVCAASFGVTVKRRVPAAELAVRRHLEGGHHREVLHLSGPFVGAALGATR